MKYEFSKHTTLKEKKQIKKYFATLNKKKTIPKKKQTVKKIHPINYAKGLTYPEFLKTEYWKSIRINVLKRDGYKCVCCQSKSKLQVHHTTYKHLGKEYLHMEELVTVCRMCHEITHGIINSDIINSIKMQYVE